MRSIGLLSCAVAAFSVMGGRPLRAATIVCPPGDNGVIQDCIDRAEPGDMIGFSGSYEIDPAQPRVEIVNKSDLRFIGDEEHPPQFSCVVESDGRPKNDAAHDGFTVIASGARVRGLVFRGLRFDGCRVAIQLLTETGGTYADIEIRNVAVSNALTGLAVFTLVEGLTISGCSILDADLGILVAGAGVLSRDVRVSGNSVVGLRPGLAEKGPQTGIFLDRVDGQVRDNRVQRYSRFVVRVGIGIVLNNTVDAASQVSAHGNFVDDSGVGISIGGQATARGAVFDNVVERASLAGINLRSGANGWRIGLNQMRNNAVDVNLTGVLAPPPDPLGTSGNTVFLTPGQTFADAGTGNTIIVKEE